MDWSNIKTIFIIAFLILNAFLGYEFFSGRHTNQHERLEVTAIVDQLDATGVTIAGEIPEEIGYVLSAGGTSKVFEESDLEDLNNQDIQLLQEGKKIVGYFQEPIDLSEELGVLNYQPFLNEVMFGDEYVFFERRQEGNAIYFVQQLNGRSIFNNQSSTIIAHLNEENQVVSYEQMYLEDLSEMEQEGELPNILTALKALESLYVRNLIPPNSELTEINLGYYRLVTTTLGLEVLVPTWRFVIDRYDVYYVNAIEGQIIAETD